MSGRAVTVGVLGAGIAGVMLAGALGGLSGMQATARATECGAPSVGALGTQHATSLDDAPFVGQSSATRSESRAVAAVIVEVGGELNIPLRGQVIAVATAMQESGLRNLSTGDRDSRGSFQQRPSQGWGSATQLYSGNLEQDVTYASTQFYRALQQVPDWQQMPLTEIAQRVQRSGFPDAYAQWEESAKIIVLANGNREAEPALLAAGGAQCPSGGAQSSFGGPLIGRDIGEKAVIAGLAEVEKGIWYSYGGGGPDGPSRGADRGFPTGTAVGYDCSSFTQMAWWRATGGSVSLPRTAAEQQRSLPPVSLHDLQPGDLIFFGSPATHVVMYAGDGAIIEAPRTGLRLRAQPGFVADGALTKSYYQRAFSGAARVAAA